MPIKTTKKAIRLEQATHTKSLFFDVKRDMNPFWKSTLFSEVYLKNDIPRVYKHIWEHDEVADETSGFFKFYDGFLDLANKHEHSSFENWKEAETVKNWIVPIMVLLGWDTDSKTEDSYYIDNESFTVTEKEKKQTYRPDLIYFEKSSHKKYTQNQNDPSKKLHQVREKKDGAKFLIEAKYWNKLSQKQPDPKRDKKVDDSAVGLGPDLQTLKYMEILDLDFGVLTDGKTWKLFHKDLSQSIDRRNYAFDLGRLKELALDVTSDNNEDKYKHYAKYFYYFFAKQSFVQGSASTIPFVYEVFNYSRKYALSIEENLKKRFIITMGLTCNALRESCVSLNENTDLMIIRNVAESHIFNILFVKSCEVRQVLPVRSIEYVKVSLHEVVESLDAMRFEPGKDEDDFFVDFQHGAAFGGKKFTYDGYQIFDRFINLYEIIHDGTAKAKDFGFEIEGFKESIFSKDEWRFAKKHKINNREMIKILFTLNFIESEFTERKYQQIPYSYFTPRQLGSIYESFLDYKLEQAESGMIFNKGQWQKANTRSNHVRTLNLVDSHIVEKGDLFFSPNNEDRKMTGSYYTPDGVVKYIIEKTLGPMVKERTSDDILNMKLCDPAMGSGHFLSGALDYLVGAYRKKWREENNDDISESVEESARKILNSCIYGIDINPRAVKLANMSLWLMTAFPGKKLERLSSQLVSGDSLNVENKFSWQQMFKNVSQEGGFDVLLANPPYGAAVNIEKGSEIFKLTTKRLSNTYGYFLEKIPTMLKDDGWLGIIVPTPWLSIDSCLKLREYYLSNLYLNELVFTFQIFGETGNAPVVDTVIAIAQKRKPRIDDQIYLRYLDERETIEKRQCQIEQRMWSRENHYDISSLRQGKHQLYDQGQIKFNDHVLLENGSSPLYKVRIGTQEYAVGKGNPPLSAIDIKKKPYHSKTKKDDTFFRFIPCGDIQRYLLRWSGGYLKWGDNLHCPRDKSIYTEDHILVSRIFDKKNNKLKCCLVRGSRNSSEIYVNNSDSFNVLLTPQSPYSLEIIIAILNSQYLGNFLLSSNINLSRAVYPKINTKDLKNIPLPTISLNNQRKLKNLFNRLEEIKTSATEVKILNEIEQIVEESFQLLEKQFVA